jgi:cysteine desulfurase
VLDVCAQLEREGFSVTYLRPDLNGIIEPEQIAAALRPDTILASFMHANNEVGIINDIAAIGALCRSRGVLLHVDAAQSAGKLPLDLHTLPVDLLSLSAHKLYGPKGIGALYVRRRPRVELEAQMHGGGHERGLRSGTLPTHQIVGLGEACRIAQEEMAEEGARLLQLRRRLWEGIASLADVHLNGDPERRLPGNLNISFGGVDGESLLLALKDIAVSTGSACTSASLEPSYVLSALGRSTALAHSALRFSLGRYSTEEEVDCAVKLLRDTVTRLRADSVPASHAQGRESSLR